MPQAPNVYMGPMLFMQALQGQLESMLQDPNIPGLGELDQAMGAGMKQPLSMAAGGGVQLNTAGNRTAGASYGPARAGLTMNNMLNKDFLANLLGQSAMGSNNIMGDYYRTQQMGASDPGLGGFMDVLQGIF